MKPVYTAATCLIAPLLPLFLRWRQLQGKENARSLREKLGHASRERPAGRLAWFHAASVGEANVALTLIEKLLALEPSLHVLLTTGTLTSATLMEKRLPPRAFHQFAPLDAPFAVRRFLKHWQPDMGVWVESELWPNLIFQAHASGCRLSLVNARLSLGSYNRWRLAASLMKQMLQCFDFIAAQSNGDTQRLNHFGAGAENLGNVKFDAGALPVDETELERVKAAIGTSPAWLAASTHDGEEALIARVHTALSVQFPALITIVVPRHPKRGAKLAEELKASLRSRGDVLGQGLYLADTLGELGLWYRASPVAFIGGSLVEHGGQNPLEAAKLGCAVLHGSHMGNFTAIREGMLEAHAAREVEDEAALLAALRELLAQPSLSIALGARARAFAEEKGGAADAIVARLQAHASA